jgi:SAM-dependent methyltransferase
MSLPRLLSESHPLGSATFLSALDEWFRGPLGASILRHETAICQQVISGSFGYHLVQCCPATPVDLGEASPIRHRVTAGPSAGIRCELHELPFASDSIDVLIVHHGLDFSPQPLGVLREAARVLIPGGKLVVAGFNPSSVWGLLRFFRRQSTPVPWRGQFLSPSRLSDWLSVLDFEVAGYEGACMGLPSTHPRVSWLNDWLDVVGNRFWNHFGAVYVMAAEKRVSRLTPVARIHTPARRPMLLPVPAKTGTVSRLSDAKDRGGDHE